MFNENSVVVQAWIRKIEEGAVTFEDVPALSNLRDVVGRNITTKEGEKDVQ